jgi:menaquinone-dependent protoporphyrinogen oxidase
VNRNSTAISQRPRAFFLVLLSAATADQKLRESSLTDARHKLTGQFEVNFEDIEFIAGALTYSKYAMPLRWLMQRIARQHGADTDTNRDYEYTDWQHVKAYGQRLFNQYIVDT